MEATITSNRYVKTGGPTTIKAFERNRKEYFQNNNEAYKLYEDFEKIILAKCKNTKTLQENLETSYSKQHTSYIKICSALKNSLITPDEMVERVIQFSVLASNIQTVLGICEQRVVLIERNEKGKVEVWTEALHCQHEDFVGTFENDTPPCHVLHPISNS